jgi:hypothetical protein
MNNCRQTFRQTKSVFNQLAQSEQKLWSLFETYEIYKFIIGATNSETEFHFNWITGMPSTKDNVNQPNDILAHPPMLPKTPACPLPVQKSLSAPSSAIIGSPHYLRPCKETERKALHLEQDLKQVVKEIKRTSCNDAKHSRKDHKRLAITRLSLGAFSPMKTLGSSTPGSLHPSSSSSIVFFS